MVFLRRKGVFSVFIIYRIKPRERGMMTVLDIAVCFLWAVTYSLVFVCTVKYRFPLISPVTQLLIAPLELAVLLNFVINNNFNINYVTLSYIYWSIIEIAILSVVFRLGYIKKGTSSLTLFC